MLLNKIYGIVVVTFALLIAMTYGNSIESETNNCEKYPFIIFNFSDYNMTTHFYFDHCHSLTHTCIKDDSVVSFSTDDYTHLMKEEDYDKACHAARAKAEEEAEADKLKSFAIRSVSPTWATVMVITFFTALFTLM